jgi:toxin ParE1/3/4
MELILSKHAQIDLDEIWLHIARRNQDTADKFLQDFEQRIHHQVQFPLTGRSRDDLAPGLRSFVFKPYVVLYRVFDFKLEVIRVLLGSRDIDSIMKKMELD